MGRVLLVFFILSHVFTAAQTIQVSGRVTAPAYPEGLPGVSVAVKETTTGNITGIDGSYTVSAPADGTLLFSFVGFKTQQIAIAGRTTIDVTMQEESKTLSEIIVTGYTSVERRDITGSVTSVKAENFKEIALSGVDQALQGQAPGVQVVQSSGTPGGGISVHIRGSTSINASNRPLFVIDGIPVESGTLSLRSFGGQDDNALSLINPGDIESIQILKDASAKAMYGSRASNGVVVITTKKGSNSRTRINLDVQRGIIDPVNKLGLLNSTQLLELQREAVMNAGQNPDALGLVPGVTDAVNTDWQDEVLRTGILQQYQLSASGGDEVTTFYMSGNYRDEEGVQLNNRLQRFTGTINIDRKFSNKFTVGSHLTLARTLNKRVKGDNFLDGVYSGALRSLPYYSPYNENGRLVGPGSPLYAGFPNFNPVAQALLPRFDAITAKFVGGLSATYQINEQFTLRSQIGLDYNDVTEDQYESSQTAIGGYLQSVGGQGYGVFIASTSTNTIANTTLTYNNVFGKHTVSSLLGAEVYHHLDRAGDTEGRLFPSDDFTYITSAGIVDNGSSFFDQNGLLSFFGEFKYDYDDKYLATLGLRTDGSSRFGPGNRFGYFPAVSAAWRISQEDFFNSSIVDDLKIRVSHGYTGNERISNYAFLGVWSSTSYNGSTGLSPDGPGNEFLKWESTRETDAGVDVSLLRGRIQTSMDAYYNKTTGLLLVRPYAATTGFGGIFDNIGDLENKGLELGIHAVNMDGAFKWTTDVNLSRNLQKVLSLSDTIPLYRGYTAEGVDATNVLRIGQPLGTFIGLNFLGVDPATGDAIYEDSNNDGVINNSDAVVLGNAQPDLIGGVTNKLSYRGFDFTAFFQFSLGNSILNFTKTGLLNTGADISDNQSVDALRRWQEPGDITDVPRYEFESTWNNQHSSRFIEDGSYLRLKNCGIGYTLGRKVADRLYFDQLRFYISATNLWTYTRYSGADPEVSTLDGSVSAQGIDFYTLPQVRTILVGITGTLK